MRGVRFVALACFIGLLIAGCGGGGDAVHVESNDEGFTISNGFVQRTMRLLPYMATVSIKNIETGKEFPVDSDEFLIVLDNEAIQLSSEDFAAEDDPLFTDLPAGGKQVRCQMANAEYGVKVEVFYEIKNESDFWIRKWLSIDPGGHLVNWVEVERFRFLPGSDGKQPVVKRFDEKLMPWFIRPWDIARGRPIYVGSQIFLGLEHPAGLNTIGGDGTVTLRQYPGAYGPLISRTAVVGVAPDRPCERVNDRFQEYIDLIRLRPVKRRVHWIAYFDVGVTDEETLEKMQFAKQTFADRGVHLDCVLMDSGWTDPKSIMGVSPVRPDRPGQIKDLAEQYLNAGLGLHVITSGQKPMVDKDWLAEEGYDLIWHTNASDGAYCLADPRVQSEFESNLVQYVRDHDIVAYKFDWGYFACSQAGHRGHLPGLEYGLEANADSFIKTLEAVRAARPDIFLFDTGWYSPWWLMYYDAIYSGGGDYNNSLGSPPAFATCTALDTYRDRVVRDVLVGWSPFFPLSSLMHHTPVSYSWGHWSCRYKDPLDRFADTIVMSYMRGSQMTEIYTNIGALTEEHRDVLASIMKWGATHDDILLAGTRLIGGDPLKGEVYGYAHFAQDGRGLIGLKNPHVIPQRFTLKLGEGCGLRPTDDKLALTIVYPYRFGLEQRPGWDESVILELQGQEVVVIEAEPETLATGRVVVDSCREETGKEPTVYNAKVTSSVTTVQGRSDVNMPQGLSGALVVLAYKANMEATVTVNGEPVEPEAPHIQVEDSKEPARTYEGVVYDQRPEYGLNIKSIKGLGEWSLFRVPLMTGQSHIEFTVFPTQADLIGRSGQSQDGALPTPQGSSVAFRCMIQTEEDLREGQEPEEPGELPNRWACILRRSVDIVQPKNLTLNSW